MALYASRYGVLGGTPGVTCSKYRRKRGMNYIELRSKNIRQYGAFWFDVACGPPRGHNLCGHFWLQRCWDFVEKGRSFC